MKKLTGKHIFQMAKIINVAHLKDELGEIILKAQEEGTSIEKVGIEGLMTVISACGDDKVEQRIYELLDDVFEAKFADMSLETINENFKKLARENNLMSFFKSAGLLSAQK